MCVCICVGTRSHRERERERERDGGILDVMVTIVGNGHVNMSSNPGQDGLHFT